MGRLIMLQVWDSVRRDACGLYGNVATSTTPTLNRMCCEGWQLDGQAQGTWTLPSMAVLLTGQSPQACGRYRLARQGYKDSVPMTEAPDFDGLKTTEEKQNARKAWLRSLPPLPETIFEKMHRMDYRTVWIASCPYAGQYALGADRPNPVNEYLDVGQHDAPRVALEFAEAWDGKDNVFVLVHTFPTHMPWSAAYRRFVEDVPDSLAKRRYVWIADAAKGNGECAYVRELYLGALHETDRWLEGMRDTLMGEDAFVAVTADHGELFGEDGFGHGGDRPLLREVPMVLWAGSHISAFPGEKPDIASHIWLHHKLLELARR